jgi:ubiquitin-small subunit ribosomal protein S27Ae
MATKKGGATGEKKGKKPHKNKPTSKKYSHYSISGDKITRNRKSCPRCGPGTFLADNKKRLYCGKCHYTEFLEKN